MLTCTYSGFATHNTCTNMQAQKTHACIQMSSSLALKVALKAHFAGKISPVLLSIPISIMLLL